MKHPEFTTNFETRLLTRRKLGAFLSAGVASALFVLINSLPQSDLRIFLFGSALVLGLMVLSLGVFVAARASSQNKYLRYVEAICGRDSAQCFFSDGKGVVKYKNFAANGGRAVQPGQTMSQSLSSLFAHPEAVIRRLNKKAISRGSAQEDILTKRDWSRVSVQQLSSDAFLWRIEHFGNLVPKDQSADTVSLPMLTASKTGTVLFMNKEMRLVLGERVKTLDRIFTQLPLRTGSKHEIAPKNGKITRLVTEISGSGGRREIYFIPENELSEQSRLSLPSFDELPVPMLKIGRDGNILAANRLARNLLADPLLSGTSVSELVEGLGRSVRDWLEDAFQGRGHKKSEVIRARKPEKEVFLQITLSQITQGDTPVLIAVLTDATELKTLEAQFVQSQKMQAIGQLAGGVAHDFNNLLTAITGHCDLLLLRHKKGDPDFSDLTQINQNAHRAASLVGQLLAFSRKQNLQPEVLNLREILCDLTHLLDRLVGEKVLLKLIHDPDLPPIRADKRQLEQVLMNLVVNARDAMHDGGEIRIETKVETLKGPLRRDRAEVPIGDYVTVRVFDTGIGIAADKLTKIFEPFYTTKKTGEGTGLGLSMAYGIVKQTGGFIFVDSVVARGTVFTIYLPCYETPEVNKAQKVLLHSKETENEEGEGVVLLVEDEAPVRAFASRALRLGGYTVIEADSAEVALKTLEDPSLDVDVFVTDVVMPGLDGPSWVRQALRDRPDVKVVFVSGYAEEAFEEGQKKIPNSIFLPKPFSLKDLTQTVRKQIH